ncbi:MAG TPA: PBP1A family penicillin-binding protein [Candidatus Saccharimonadales bacterium]|nr:PBP1A family penicillin-binding protein [Candidatus Saccharimonadales bacterium]
MLRTFSVLGITALIMLAGAGYGAVQWMASDLPSPARLQSIAPPVKTIVYDEKHRVVGEFFKENRTVVPLARIPRSLIDASISTEDRNFYSHWGVSLWGIARAALKDLVTMRRAQGGSTITQQLARNLFLTNERSLSRKIKEMILAVRIEQQYSKDQILEMYFNQVYFGEGAYGVDAAARVYFDKALDRLSLPECALIAGLTQNPLALNPRRHPQAALRRRSVVLHAMLENHKITEPQYRAASAAPLGVTASRPSSNRAPYFMEMIRQYLDEKYGSNQIYEGGLRVYTTLDVDLQRAAETALENQLARLELEQHYRVTRAMVNAGAPHAEHAHTGYIQGAFVALEPSTGAIRALVGGRDFAQSNFNRATQALRQPGSAFKPFVYTAAIDNGYRPTDPIVDAPLSYRTATGVWEPSNYDDKFRGAITLRYALAHSINIPAIKLTERLTPLTVASYAHRLGIKGDIPNNLTIALGTSETTLLDLAAAYTTFANQGVRAEPLYLLKVEDRNGRVLERSFPKVQEVLSQGTAATMTSMLQSVVDEGTAAASRRMGFTRPAAGKTGTTNDFADAWFVGFTPGLLAACWVGFDQRQTLGNKMTGNHAALPMWVEFMKVATQDQEVRSFPESAGTVVRQICVQTGLLATPYCPQTVMETFPLGQEPQQTCNVHTSPSSPGARDPNAPREEEH